MDRFSAVAPACVRVSLLPVGQVERSAFLHLVSKLRQHASVVPLEGLISLVKGEDFSLSPLHFPQGSILFNYAVSEIPESQRQLAPFELCRESLLVLGVVAGLHGDHDQQITQLKNAANELREKHGRVVHRHLLVLADEGVPLSTHLAHVTTLDNANKDDICQAMQQITIQFLHEFATYVKAMQMSPSIQTPGQVSQGILRSMILRREEARPRSSHNTPGEPRSPSGEEINARPTSQDIMPPATTFDQMPAANALGRSDSNASHRSKSRPRTTSFDRVPTLSKEKTKDRGRARVGVVTGCIYLMSGQWAEALKILVDNTTRLRALNDHIWNGKGLELIVVCLILQLWAGVDVQVPAICYQLSDKVRDRFSKAFAAELAQKISGPQTAAEKLSSSLPDLLMHILLLYHSVEGTMELPYITIAEATVRLSKILACLHGTSGLLNEKSISRIVEQNIPPTDLRWSSATFHAQKPLSKIGICELLAHALPANDESLALVDHISILTGIASVHALLKMDRKKSITLKALVARLTAALNHARKVGAAEMGIHPAASLSVDNGSEVLTDTMHGSTGLIQLAQDIASVYGVDLRHDQSRTDTLEHNSFGSRAMKLEILGELLRLCEASPDLKGVSMIVVASMTSAGQFGSCDSTATRRSITLPAEEQSRLVGMLSRASWLSRQLKIEPAEGHYWDPFLLRGIALHTTSRQQVISDLSASQTVRTTSEMSTNPLLYDPNAPRLLEKEQNIILPLGEMAQFRLTLQNPFDVFLDIETLELVTDGVALECSHRDIRLSPARLEHIVVDVLPQTLGDTNIIACRAKIVGCIEQTYMLTISPWACTGNPLVKSMGQLALAEGTSTQQSTLQHTSIAIKVVDAQPQLLHNDTISSRRIMLLEGEKQYYSLTLENISEVPATILSIACQTASIELTNDFKPNTIIVGPHQSYMQEFRLVGEVTTSIARASITYSASINSGLTRVCEISLDLTVKPALRIQHLNVLAGEGNSLIFVLDLQNVWLKPIGFTYGAGTAQCSQFEGLLDAGRNARIQLQSTSWFESTKLWTDSVEIKQELHKHLHIAWRTSDRSGDVSLDAVSLSEETISVLRSPAISISLDLLDTKSEPMARNESTVGQFMTIHATVTNRSKAIGPMIVQLQCRTLDLTPAGDRQVAIAGSMSRLISCFSPEGTTSTDFAICPLSTGVVVIDALIRPVLSSQAIFSGSTRQSLRLHITE